jgi:hypothetical protein
MGLRLAAAIGMFAWSISSGFAEPDRAPVPIKPAAMPEKGLQLPFDLKTDPGIKVRGPDAQNFPAALAPITREHRPFFGVGISQPIGPDN